MIEVLSAPASRPWQQKMQESGATWCNPNPLDLFAGLFWTQKAEQNSDRTRSSESRTIADDVLAPPNAPVLAISRNELSLPTQAALRATHLSPSTGHLRHLIYQVFVFAIPWPCTNSRLAHPPQARAKIRPRPAMISSGQCFLTCLDQCHGVRFHRTSSSQGWRQRIVTQQSEFDPWVHILVFAEGDCCRFA